MWCEPARPFTTEGKPPICVASSELSHFWSNPAALLFQFQCVESTLIFNLDVSLFEWKFYPNNKHLKYCFQTFTVQVGWQAEVMLHISRTCHFGLRLWVLGLYLQAGHYAPHRQMLVNLPGSTPLEPRRLCFWSNRCRKNRDYKRPSQSKCLSKTSFLSHKFQWYPKLTLCLLLKHSLLLPITPINSVNLWIDF